MQAAEPGGPSETVDPDEGATVAVIIPTFNQARFLADAIDSVLEQTHPADEIIVVDDGSIDNPAAVITHFKAVRLIRQDNRGPSAARNTGLRSCATSHVVFLDADDRLLPTAVEAGLACMAAHPNCAFVYGGHRRISDDGRPLGGEKYTPIGDDAHQTLLQGNRIGPPSTALFRRDSLLALNGFDESLRRSEDSDLYLRIVQKYAIASHPEIVAEYRRHSQNVSNDHCAQLKWALHVLDLHEARIANDASARTALREARTSRRRHYVSEMLEATSARWRAGHDFGTLMKDLIQAARWSPLLTMRTLLGADDVKRRATELRLQEARAKRDYVKIAVLVLTDIGVTFRAVKFLSRIVMRKSHNKLRRKRN